MLLLFKLFIIIFRDFMLDIIPSLVGINCKTLVSLSIKLLTILLFYVLIDYPLCLSFIPIKSFFTDLIKLLLFISF